VLNKVKNGLMLDILIKIVPGCYLNNCMKNITLLFSILFSINYAFGQVKAGDAVPDVNFNVLLNAPVTNISLSELKGKVILIDFWATWCSPCVDAMPHLSQLQTKYQGKLQVITVTDEKAARIRQYLTTKPSNLWVAIDTERVAVRIFPHTTIPHTVIISPDGKVIATTDPQFVTEAVMDSVLQKKEVHLPNQKGILLEPSDIIKKYFFAADTVKNKFIMQAELKGANSFSTMYQRDSIFKGRRFTCVNFQLNGLYRIAYHDFPYSRTIDKTGEKKNAPLYCLDLIVANKKYLLPALQKELAKRFDLQAKIEQQTKDAYVLKITDREKFEKIPVNTSGRRTFGAMHGEIDEERITMADFANYLENYGIEKLPVIDETLNKGFFDIKFSFQPEKPESLVAVLNNMGLTLEKQSRKIDFLVLYK
jgi:thiol-disulfide isomerase/thioredoxin